MSKKNGKRLSEAKKNIDLTFAYDMDEAIDKLLASPVAKFDESIEVAVNLNLDTKHSDQIVRDSVVLPHGTGKEIRVAVFAKGQHAIDAEEAKADIVGAEDLCDQIKQGIIAFDKCVATPDMMGVVGSVAKILGPKGLMPNPKVGTVTTDVKKVVESLKSGQIEFRTDKFGIVHAMIGKRSFAKEKIIENLKAFLVAIKSAKPSGAKGIYIKSIFVSSTMGIGVKLNNSAI